MHKRFLFTALALPLLVAACDKGLVDPDGSSSKVSVKFGMNGPSASASKSSALFSTSSVGGLVIEGSNGTLTVTNVSFIVSELELEAHDGACDGIDKAGCPDFEAPPSFVRLPLGTGAVEVTSKPVPAGTYTELEFEVESLEVDEDDDQTKRQQVLDLLASIRQTYADFPENASMVVEGTFLATGTTEAIPFRVYFDAEIEVEMDLVPALTISDTGASRSLLVDVQPALWFKKPHGTVMDLSQFDYAKTGALIEFEVEMDKGFTKIEFDD